MMKLDNLISDPILPTYKKGELKISKNKRVNWPFIYQIDRDIIRPIKARKNQLSENKNVGSKKSNTRLL